MDREEKYIMMLTFQHYGFVQAQAKKKSILCIFFSKCSVARDASAHSRSTS